MSDSLVVPLASIERELLKIDGCVVAEDDRYIVVTTRVEKRVLSEIVMRTHLFFAPKSKH